MILFKNITFKNFLSVGDDGAVVELANTPMTLIEGSNGAGKTTIMEAITFALFGKAYRNINKGALVNSINKKGTVVTIEFDAYGIEWKIIRGIKPDVFEIIKNGDAIDKDSNAREMQAMLERNILKFNYDTFCQVVLLGSTNLVPFFQLSAKGRREVVEELLGIRVLGVMNLLLKDRLKNLKDEVKDIQSRIYSLDIKLGKQQQFVDYIRHTNEKAQLDVSKKKEDLQKKIDDALVLIGELECVQFGPEPEDYIAVSNYYDAEKLIDKFIHKIDSYNTTIKYYTENGVCHTCGQSIQEDFKQDKIRQAEEKTDTINVHLTSLHKLRVQYHEEMEEARKAVAKHREEVSKYKNELNSLRVKVKSWTVELNELDNTDEVSHDELIKQEMELEFIGRQINSDKEVLYTKQEELNQHKVCELILKDEGVKKHIMGEYLPMINTLLEKYLREFGFRVFLKLDSSFEIEIETPTHLNFTYDSFSEGEKKRIDLAVLLVFLEVSAARNSVHTNVLFLDEVFDSSLDDVGSQELLRVFRDTVSKEKNIFVISHTMSDVLRDSFGGVIKVVKQGSFTTYK